MEKFEFVKMLKAMLGKKLNMDRTFDSHGRALAVTKIFVEPNFVVSLKSKESQGYKAAEIGFGEKRKITKQMVGHFKKAGLKKNLSKTREVAFDGELSPGMEIRIEDVFRKGVLVDVVGISKGKGFAGGVKRHGFRGGPKTHGQSDRHRAPGSIGSGTTPGRVFKGTRMAGHMGAERVTVQGLQVVDIDKENNLIVIKGSVPGPAGSTILLRKSSKKPKAYHEPEIPEAPNIGGGKDEEEATEADNSENQVEKKIEEAIEVKDGNQE